MLLLGLPLLPAASLSLLLTALGHEISSLARPPGLAQSCALADTYRSLLYPARAKTRHAMF